MRLGNALHIFSLDQPIFFIPILMIFVWAICNQRLFALQRTLVKKNVIDKEIGKIMRCYAVAIGFVLRIQHCNTVVIEFLAAQLLNKLLLSFKNLLQLIFVKITLNDAHQLSFDFLLGIVEQCIEYVCSYGEL